MKKIAVLLLGIWLVRYLNAVSKELVSAFECIEGDFGSAMYDQPVEMTYDGFDHRPSQFPRPNMVDRG